MQAYIVETNVALVANDRAGQAPTANRACVLSCIRNLRDSVDILMGRRPGVLAVDAGGEIMSEYRRHLHGSGQPGTGDAFFYEMSQREYGPTCERVTVTRDDDTYREFPKTAAL